MRPFGFTIQLLLTSVVASATAGLLALTLLVAGVAARDGGGVTLGSTLYALLFALVLGGLAIIPAVTLLTIPTMFVGAFVWLLAGRRAWAGRPSSFAVTGAVAGGIGYAMLAPAGPLGLLMDSAGAVGTEWWAGAAFLIAGACSGLVFRSTMHALGSFFGEDVKEEDQAEHQRPAP
jgi:hypothetical protein